jgi:hypothetical protein
LKCFPRPDLNLKGLAVSWSAAYMKTRTANAKLRAFAVNSSVAAFTLDRSTPRVGFEPTTRRLIPTRRDSTVEQVLANPTRRFHTLDLSFACHCGATGRVWLGPNEAPRAILVCERKVTSDGVVVFRETANRIVAGTDVESPSTVLQDVDPTSNLLVFQAPRVGFEPTTRRLTAGCSTVELSGNAPHPGATAAPRNEQHNNL